MTADTSLADGVPEPDVDTDAGAYLTRREVAARCRVPLSTFDSLRRQNRVPFPDAHMGKHMLWRSATIEHFLQSGGTYAGR